MPTARPLPRGLARPSCWLCALTPAGGGLRPRAVSSRPILSHVCRNVISKAACRSTAWAGHVSLPISRRRPGTWGATSESLPRLSWGPPRALRVVAALCCVAVPHGLHRFHGRQRFPCCGFHLRFKTCQESVSHKQAPDSKRRQRSLARLHPRPAVPRGRAHASTHPLSHALTHSLITPSFIHHSFAPFLPPSLAGPALGSDSNFLNRNVDVTESQVRERQRPQEHGHSADGRQGLMSRGQRLLLQHKGTTGDGVQRHPQLCDGAVPSSILKGSTACPWVPCHQLGRHRARLPHLPSGERSMQSLSPWAHPP